VDNIILYIIYSHLFERTPGFGMDLAATNSQRGWDFGIPGYKAYRRWCGLSGPRSFSPDQLADIRSVTLAAVICRNSNIGTVQPRILRHTGPGKEIVDCDTSRHIDLTVNGPLAGGTMSLRSSFTNRNTFLHTECASQLCKCF